MSVEVLYVFVVVLCLFVCLCGGLMSLCVFWGAFAWICGRFVV